MSKVTIRVPATTANLGPGFDAFGCALSLYTYVTFEETESGLEITGCDESFTGSFRPLLYRPGGGDDLSPYWQLRHGGGGL